MLINTLMPVLKQSLVLVIQPVVRVILVIVVILPVVVKMVLKFKHYVSQPVRQLGYYLATVVQLTHSLQQRMVIKILSQKKRKPSR